MKWGRKKKKATTHTHKNTTPTWSKRFSLIIPQLILSWFRSQQFVFKETATDYTEGLLAKRRSSSTLQGSGLAVLSVYASLWLQNKLKALVNKEKGLQSACIVELYFLWARSPKIKICWLSHDVGSTEDMSNNNLLLGAASSLHREASMEGKALESRSRS